MDGAVLEVNLDMQVTAIGASLVANRSDLLTGPELLTAADVDAQHIEVVA